MSTAHPRIMKAHEAYMSWPELQSQLQQLHQAAESEDEAAIRAVLHTCVNGFNEQAF